MNMTHRLLEYKKLALILQENPTKELAAQIASMCDDDARLRADKYVRGLSFIEAQALEYIVSIGNKARPSVRDSHNELVSKAGDILMEIAYFEAIPQDEKR